MHPAAPSLRALRSCSQWVGAHQSGESLERSSHGTRRCAAERKNSPQRRRARRVIASAEEPPSPSLCALRLCGECSPVSPAANRMRASSDCPGPSIGAVCLSNVRIGWSKFQLRASRSLQSSAAVQLMAGALMTSLRRKREPRATAPTRLTPAVRVVRSSVCPTRDARPAASRFRSARPVLANRAASPGRPVRPVRAANSPPCRRQANCSGYRA